jgi:endonuclease/exonuclease/phosphatase family metal-dependent hydrolase
MHNFRIGWIAALLSSAAAGAVDFTVASFNLRYITREDTGPRTWTARRDFAAELMKGWEADFLCLQEAFRSMLDDVHERLPGYGEAGVGREDGKEKGEYSAILFRQDAWELRDSGTFWLSDTPEKPGSATWGNTVTRICTWGKFRHRASGRTLAVFNAHFDHQSQPSRQRAAALVLERINRLAGPDPAVFTGDLNAAPDNPAIRTLREGPPGLRDAWQELHRETPPALAGTSHGFTGTAAGRRIDYVLFSPGIEPREAEIVRAHNNGAWPSDHFPVLAKLRLGAALATIAPDRFADQPLVWHAYTADPSAHVFKGRVFLYPSHDIDAGVPPDDLGSHFAMRDYRVFSMPESGGPVTDHGVALDLADVPWAKRQMWAPDAAEKDGRHYLYFPAKDRHDVFRIGVAVADQPAGPFRALPEPIPGSYSIDPAVFRDDDGSHYMYFGGIWGGQLQRWAGGGYRDQDVYPAPDQPALCAKVAPLANDMASFAEPPRDVVVLDEQGRPLRAGDNARRFFEAAWMHKHQGTYYFSYSTGDTHFIAYATGDSPRGPFTYRGRLLEPVLGWTTHHSIVQAGGRWRLFYHDCQLSRGQTHLRNIKVTDLVHRPDGTIATIDPYLEPPTTP